MDIQPYQLDIDELNALMKNRQMIDRSSAAQLDDVNQRWTLILQRMIDTKVTALSQSTLSFLFQTLQHFADVSWAVERSFCL